MCWVTTHVLIIDHGFRSPRHYACNTNHVFSKILPRVLNWAARKANASGEALADQMELKVWDVLREWRICCLVWYSIDTWTWLYSWTSHRNKIFWRPPFIRDLNFGPVKLIWRWWMSFFDTRTWPVTFSTAWKGSNLMRMLTSTRRRRMQILIDDDTMLWGTEQDDF